MDNSIKKEILFDAMIRSALQQYIDETERSQPTDDELRRMYPIPRSGLKKIKKEIKKRRRTKRSNAPIVIAVMIIVAVISAFTVILSVPVIRGAAGDLIEELFGIKIIFQSSTANKTPQTQDTDASLEENARPFDYEITYIPEGYTQRETSESPNRGYYCYFDDNGRYIYISISLADRTSVSLEKDTFEHERLNINGRECHLAYDENNSYGTAIIADNGFVIQIDAIAEKAEILKIAEGMLSQAPESTADNSLPVILY